MIGGTCISALPISAPPAAPASRGPVLPLPSLPPFVVPPGIVLARSVEDALWAAYVAGGMVALTATQVLAITGPAPVFPATLPCDGEDGQHQAAYGFDLELAR